MAGEGGEASTRAVKGLTALMVEIVQSPGSGLRLVESAGELIAENARFNLWAYERKSRSTARELWNITAVKRQSREDCSSAWVSYSTSHDGSLRLDELMGALQSATDRLRAVRVSDSVAFDDPEMPEELRDW